VFGAIRMKWFDRCRNRNEGSDVALTGESGSIEGTGGATGSNDDSAGSPSNLQWWQWRL